MPVSEATLKQLVIKKVGDVNPETGDPTTLDDGILASNIDDLWDLYDEFSPSVQEAYVRRDAIDLVLAVLSEQVDFTRDGLSVRLNQRVQVYERKRELAINDIARASGRNHAPATGTITTVKPADPDLHPDGPGLRRGVTL